MFWMGELSRDEVDALRLLPAVSVRKRTHCDQCSTRGWAITFYRPWFVMWPESRVGDEVRVTMAYDPPVGEWTLYRRQEGHTADGKPTGWYIIGSAESWSVRLR